MSMQDIHGGHEVAVRSQWTLGVFFRDDYIKVIVTA